MPTPCLPKYLYPFSSEPAPAPAATLRVCADGGANRLYDELPGMLPGESAEAVRAQYLPTAIQGDLDSIRPDVVDFYRRHGVPVHDLSGGALSITETGAPKGAALSQPSPAYTDSAEGALCSEGTFPVALGTKASSDGLHDQVSSGGPMQQLGKVTAPPGCHRRSRQHGPSEMHSLRAAACKGAKPGAAASHAGRSG